jgi:hypothetical protein
MDRKTAKFIVENAAALVQLFNSEVTCVNIYDNDSNFIKITRKVIDCLEENAAVIEAYANGAEIQYLDPKFTKDSWEGVDEPSFVKPFKYRVKPKPREFYIGRSKSTGTCKVVYEANAIVQQFDNLEYIKVREVL